MKSCPLARSKEIRHGFRRPYAQISPRPACGPANGLLRGHGVVPERARPGAVDVDPQDLAEQGVSSPGRRCPGPPRPRRRRRRCTGSHSDRMPALRRCDCPAPVLDQHERAGGPATGRRPGRVRRVPRDDDVTAVARVVDVEPVVRLEPRVERKAQQPALAAVVHLRADVQEEARLQRRRSGWRGSCRAARRRTGGPSRRRHS